MPKLGLPRLPALISKRRAASSRPASAENSPVQRASPSLRVQATKAAAAASAGDQATARRHIEPPAPPPSVGMGSPAARTWSPMAPRSAAIAELVLSEDFDWDTVLLDEWSLSFNGSRPLQLTGRVFNNSQGFEEGDVLEYTSQLVGVDGRVATTKSGTKYYLVAPAAGFAAIRAVLCRDDPAVDPEHPLAGVDLGPLVPCQAVGLPRVPGWDPDEGVALLQDWCLARNAAGFHCVRGTIYNMPGEYDGTKGYETDDVVDLGGRVLETVRGYRYYLGKRTKSGHTPARRASAGAGGRLSGGGYSTVIDSIDDLLAV